MMKEQKQIHKSQIDERKEKLRKEMEALEEQLENSVQEVGEEVSDQFDPKTIIRKHPYKSLGVSLLTGFVLSYRSKSLGSSSVWSTVKKEIANQALRYATDIVTNFSKKNENKRD